MFKVIFCHVWRELPKYSGVTYHELPSKQTSKLLNIILVWLLLEWVMDTWNPHDSFSKSVEKLLVSSSRIELMTSRPRAVTQTTFCATHFQTQTCYCHWKLIKFMNKVIIKLKFLHEYHDEPFKLQTYNIRIHKSRSFNNFLHCQLQGQFINWR